VGKQESKSAEQKLVDLQAESLTKLAWAYAYAGRFDGATQRLQAHQALLSADVSVDVQMRIYDNLGFIAYRSCEWEKAESYFLQNFRMAQESGDRGWIAFAASCLTCVYNRSRDYTQLRKFAALVMEVSKMDDGKMSYEGYIAGDTLGWVNGNLEMCMDETV
jgi:tetratricopeptide (TPR) repeat protein